MTPLSKPQDSHRESQLAIQSAGVGISRLARAVEIARRSIFIALEGVYVGIGLSLAGMAAAAFGFLKPVEGAIFQEIIDVAVILNALRALAGEAG